MKSVLCDIELRAQEALFNTDGSEQKTIANVTASSLTATAVSLSEQLAELELLSRRELELEIEDSSSSAAAASSVPSDVRDTSDNDGAPQRRDTDRVEQKSTFTALLGGGNSRTSPSMNASSSLQAQPASSTHATSATSPAASSLRSPRATSKRLQRASSLPTLSEEPFEDAADESRSSSIIARAIGNADHDDDITVEAATGEFSSGTSFSQRRNSKPPASYSSDDEQQHASEPASDELDRSALPQDSSIDDDDGDDEGFLQMLEQLVRDSELLVLSPCHLTVRRLERVRRALLAQSVSSGSMASRGVAHSSMLDSTDERVETPVAIYASEDFAMATAAKSSASMRHVRTIVAVDTLRLLLQRCGRDNAVAAITEAVRTIFDQRADASGIEPLRHSPAVVTSRNVAHVALLARECLDARERRPERASPAAHSQHSRSFTALSSSHRHSHNRQQQQVRRAQQPQSPTRTASPVRAASEPAPLSPRRSPSLRASSSATRPLTPQRRSILASDGNHVLLQEKLSAFQFRGPSSNSGLALFKVQRDGGAAVEAAAMRRTRSLEYGKEQVRKAAMK